MSLTHFGDIKMFPTTKLSTLFITAICASSLALPAFAGDWLARVRVINVSPDDSSGQVPGVPGSGVSPGTDTTLEVDFTYMLSKNLGLELILATSKHSVSGTGTLAGADVGKVSVIPPTLTLQYHFKPNATIRPYAGLGVNYSYFYDGKLGAALLANGATDINYDDSFGLSAQAGADFDINKNWFVNLDLKYVQINTTATIVGGNLAGNVDVDINPWIFGVGIGTRF